MRIVSLVFSFLLVLLSLISHTAVVAELWINGLRWLFRTDLQTCKWPPNKCLYIVDTDMSYNIEEADMFHWDNKVLYTHLCVITVAQHVDSLLEMPGLCAVNLVVSRTMCKNEGVEKCTLNCFKEKQSGYFFCFIFISIQKVHCIYSVWTESMRGL